MDDDRRPLTECIWCEIVSLGECVLFLLCFSF